MSRNLELSQLAKTLTVNADGTVTGLNIDASNIDGIPNTDLNIAPEVLEIQVSAPQAGQDTQWLWTWLTSSLPYARREITNSPEVQVPLYKQGTYTVNNFAAYDIFDQMTQTHSLYLKWIDGAGTDNLISWATSTGPVSDTHPDINSGNATDVQRINISVPSTVTPPTLTAPSVSYTVTNNGSGAYTFSGAAKGDNPNLGPFYRGGTYTIDITATGHPFYFTTDNGTNFAAGTYFGEYTSGVTGSRTDSGTITFTVPQNAPDTLYYQCGNHSSMRGAITVKDLAVEVNNNGNYIVYFQHTQEGHKTPVEIRPIPSLVNQMCLVYDANAGAFVPQDLATYVENTPSFENKIREVAGTAELVVEDGSAVVAKVNVYADSTYLPLTGNNAGDQAFATDNNILYIWDGSAWQQAGATNTDEITEGSTNLFYTDTRVANYLSSNDFDTATNIVATITDSAPVTLDTLNELAAALGDDPNFATTVTNSIGTKLATADFDSTFDTRLATKTTDDLTEGSNLYYTTTRSNTDFDTRLATKSTTNVAEGTNQYFTQARVQSTPINAGSLRGTVNNATVQYGTSYSGTPAQGSFFFDSLNQKLKIYTGSAFVDAVPAGTGSGGGGGETAANATFRKYTYSISSSTNAVSGADDNAETLSYATTGQNVEVYRNGVKQVEGASNDYVASTGTSVNFTYNLSSGDVVDVQVYELLTNDAFYLKTETYTQTEVNSQISTGLSSYLPLGGGTMTGTLDVNADIDVQVPSGKAAYFASNDPTPQTNNHIVIIRDNLTTANNNGLGTIGITSQPGNDVYIGKRWDTSLQTPFAIIRGSNSAEHFTANLNNSNIGLNIENPTSPLHVYRAGGGSIEPFAHFQNDGGDASIKIQAAGGEAYLEIANTSLTSGDQSNSWGIGTNDDTDLNISYGTNGTMNKNSEVPYLFISSATGNVGIGMDNPSADLHVDAGTNGWEGGIGLTTDDGNTTYYIHPENNDGGVMFGYSGATKETRIVPSIGIGIGKKPEYSLDFSATDCQDGIALPRGTEAQRPTPTAGLFRYNTDASSPEFYNGSSWRVLDAPGTTSSSPAPSAKWLYDNGFVTSGKGLYWIDTDPGGAVQVFCDFDTQDENGASGWMLVASYDVDYQWTYGGNTTASTIGTTFSGRQISANFGNMNTEMWRVTVNNSINTSHGTSANGDWYYYKSGGTTWKEWWAPSTGYSYYNGQNFSPQMLADDGVVRGRQANVPFTHAHNIKFNYTTTQHIYNSLSDASVNTSGYYAGGTTSQYWEALTTSGNFFSVYYQAVNTSNAASSDGTIGILPQGFAGTQNCVGQDTTRAQSKTGSDDNNFGNYYGSSATSDMNAGNYSTVNASGVGMMWWIK